MILLENLMDMLTYLSDSNDLGLEFLELQTEYEKEQVDGEMQSLYHVIASDDGHNSKYVFSGVATLQDTFKIDDSEPEVQFDNLQVTNVYSIPVVVYHERRVVELKISAVEESKVKSNRINMQSLSIENDDYFTQLNPFQQESIMGAFTSQHGKPFNPNLSNDVIKSWEYDADEVPELLMKHKDVSLKY